jgi:hypothetical protein
MHNDEFERERAQFRELLLTNPNYFGTAEESDFDVVEPIQLNTKYEEIGCVGFDPKHDRLEAVVHVKQPYGYGGGICTNGTPEYVRFYLSFDGGATWNDQGMVSFRAYDIPEGTDGRKKLEYAVALHVEGLTRLCQFTETVLCRAILSWNDPPTPGTPDFTPVWGEVHHTHLLTEPIRLLPLPDFFESVDVKLPETVLDQIDLSQNIKLAEPKSLSLRELAKKYGHGPAQKKPEVEPSRFAFAEIQKLLRTTQTTSLTAAFAESPLAELDFDLQDLVQIVEEGDGDTRYEEMECVGLFPNEDLLISTFRIKRSSGYSGDPCTDGSTEYVTFWADFDDDGTFETNLGTTSVTVYDFDEIPDEGLEYSVTLPVDLSEHRQPCTDGPRLVRIRAILSWNSPPDPSDPDFVPVWGNREETTIHVAPGPKIDGPGAYISILGGIPVSMIHDVTGLTTSSAIFALSGLAPDPLGRPCPFGRRVVVQGPQFAGYKYRVRVREVGTATWSTVARPIKVTDLNGNVSTHHPDPGGLFTFLSHHQNIASVLAWWNTAGDDRWEVRLEVYNPAGTTLLDVDTHRIQLDNTAPEAEIEITSGTGNCGKFGEGTTISGVFKARDAYLRSYALNVLPGDINDPGEGIPSPPSGTSQTSSSGDSWSLDTTGMQACGYVLEVVARDRAILNSSSVGHRRRDTVGFCLED